MFEVDISHIDRRSFSGVDPSSANSRCALRVRDRSGILFAVQLPLARSETKHSGKKIQRRAASAMLLAFFLVYVVFGFIQVLVSIAKGDPFSEQNVWRMKIIALILLIIPTILFILNLLMPLIFSSYFTDDIHLNDKAHIFFRDMLFFGVIFGTLYLAFKKGRKMREEQEFTI